MITKQNLEQYTRLKNQCAQLERCCANLRASEQQKNSDTANIMEGFLHKKKEQLLQQRDVIQNAIVDLDAAYCQVLCLYYLEGLSWEKVAQLTNYSSVHCMRLRNEALKKMIVL